ncbi:MAG: protein-L-isoaspartate O-methyltransferase [Paracoccaceae bacterium]
MADYAARRTTMVDTQVRPSDVTKYPIIKAMLTVPREAFVPNDKRETAYIGKSIDLGGGRVVLEPRTLAKMLDAADIQRDELVLDVGCGLGYSSAVIARLSEAVVALEEDEAMAAHAERLLGEYGFDNAAVIQAPLTEGAAKHGPYDVIVIEGGIEELPQHLFDQLKEGGRVVAIFVEAALGICRIGHKLSGHIDWRFSFNAGAPLLKEFTKSRAFVL